MAEEENTNQSESSEEIPKEIIPDEVTAPKAEDAESEAQPELSEPTIEPTNMEVHHHAHIHSKSKWKEYIFQFFMLFLAVFCGFLAEYQLEHKIERDRERVYMTGMIEDLVADTTELAFRLQFMDSSFFPVFEKGLELLYSRDISDSSVALMYETVPKCVRFMEVQFEYRTKIQLMNSGNLRLIRNEQVTDSLASYWKSCESVKDPVLIGYAETRSKAKWAVHELFDFTYFEEYLPMAPLKNGAQPKLLQADSQKLITLANHIANLRSQATGPLSVALKETKDKAERLITLIRKEYHFE